MKTPLRILVTGGIALAVFAGSFAIAKANTNSKDTGVDAALEVPATVTTQAPVLSPVDVGDITGDAASGLSPTIGSAEIKVPADQLDPTDDLAETPTPDPSATFVPEPGPDVIAAAAALDSAGGEDIDLITRPADDSATPAPSPTESAGTGSTPASDPCADSASGDCPAGLAATLYDLTLDTDLQVYAVADPVTSSDQYSVVWCPATAVPAGTLRMGAFATEASTVTIDYWPVGHPSAIKHMTPAQAQHYSDGSARYCGHTDVLEDGAYDGIVTTQTADGRVSDPKMFHFDSRGRPTVPVMRVVPLGHNWVWVGVLHNRYQSALVRGLGVADGTTTDCDGAGSTGYLSTAIDAHTSEMSAEYLALHNYDPTYQRSTSAVIYVPEGRTAYICGLTFNEREPSWDRSVPERVQTATVTAPNAWTAIVTVRSVSTYRPGQVAISANGQLGGACGPQAWVNSSSAASDTATVMPVGQEICRLAGQNIRLEVQTQYTKDDGTRGSARQRSVISGIGCAGDCAAPAERTYSVFLPGLGQDGCPDSTADDCDVRRRTMGALATVDVTWERTSRGNSSTWAVSGTADANITDAHPDAPQFDTDSFLTASLNGSDFFHATATGQIKFDRAVDYTAQAIGPCFGDGATESTSSGHSSSPSAGVSSATLTFRNLCPGTQYYVVVRYSDADGNSGVAAPPSTPGIVATVPWYGGSVGTPQKYLKIKAAIEIHVIPSFDANWGVYNSWLYLDGDGFVPSFRKSDGSYCYQSTHEASSASSDIVLPLQNSYVLTQDVDIQSDYYFWSTRRPRCDFRWYDTWSDPQARTVSLYQLTHGITLAAPLVNTHSSGLTDPFRYDIHLTAEVQDSPEP